MSCKPKDLSFLQEAAKAFTGLERKANTNKKGITKIPHRFENHILALNFAHATLHSLGRSSLSDLEKKGVIHGSTIAGASLSISTFRASKYMLGKEDSFSGDNYEQFARSCLSAKSIYERGIVS